ncbi:MAG: VOC family protein [Actinomycetales bacterium]
MDNVDALEQAHQRILDAGGAVLFDRSNDPEEPLWVYADPSGHPFCIFVVSP